MCCLLGGTKQQKEVKSPYDNEFADFEGSLDNWSKFDAILEPDLITTVKSNPKRPVKKGIKSYIAKSAAFQLSYFLFILQVHLARRK